MLLEKNMKIIIYWIYLITLIQQNNGISFVDVQLTKIIDGTLIREIHRKSAVGQYIHFYSVLPIRYKKKLNKDLDP